METSTTTKGHEYCGAKMFDSKKTAKYFLDMCDVLGETGEPLREEFVQEVKDLFDAKVTSEEGVYDSYKITEADLNALARNY